MRRVMGCRGRLHTDRAAVGHGPSDRDHCGSQSFVGSQDSVVAVSMEGTDAKSVGRGRNEAGQALEQLEGPDAKRLATVHAIEAVFPKTQVQLCIVHLIRGSLRYVSWKERKALAHDHLPGADARGGRGGTGSVLRALG